MDLPREVNPLTELEKLRKTASMKREALVFVKVNPQNTQEFVEEAVEDYVDDFKRYGPVFLVPLDTKDEELPRLVAAAFSHLSGTYPHLVVSDPDDDKIIVKVSYVSADERKEELREHRRTVHRYLQDKKRKPRVPPPQPAW
jgi:hypothetical protein